MASPTLRKHFLAHWFGCGLFPKAPGTVGTLGALPLHWLLLKLSILPHALVVVALTAIGFAAAGAASKDWQDEDPSAVVIDEVAGMLIAGWFVRGQSWVALVSAFILFRVLDITKPSIIDKAQHVGPPGVSIMLDDLLAGLGAGLLAHVVGLWL